METSSITSRFRQTVSLPRFLSGFRRGLVRDAPFLLLAVAFVMAAVVSARVLGYPADLDLSVSWSVMATWTGLYAVPAFLALLVHGKVVNGYSIFEASTWRRVGFHFADPGRLLGLVLVVGVLPFFTAAFVAFKGSIPDVSPFVWDVRFMEWDRLVHFGAHPWELLQPVLGYPVVTNAIDFTYYLWFPVVWLTMIWQAWHGDRNSDSRMQYLLTFALSWILLGTVAATWLSSAGPVYFASVTGEPDPFLPLMDYLRAVNGDHKLQAIWAQDILWQSYADPSRPAIEGISAMPSMHVAMGVLMALLGFRIRPWVGWCYTIFAVLILLGSVHLAWHYAIDGYVAAAGTLLIWRACGRFSRWWRTAVCEPGLAN